MRVLFCFALALTLCGCSAEETDTDTDPPPPTHTARFVVDLQTHYWDWGGTHGLAANKGWITAEHTLADLPPLEVPASGTCTKDSTLFAPSPYPAGAAIEGTGERPRWELAGGLSELLVTLVDGLYTADGVRATGTGIAYQDYLGDGYVLQDMGLLSGTTSLAFGTTDEVFVDGKREDQVAGPIDHGSEHTLSWQASDWDDSFVMVRRIYLGDTRGEVVCGTSGLTSYTLGSDAWSLMPQLGEDEHYEVFVGFQRRADLGHPDPYWNVEGVSRLLHAWDPDA